MRKEFVQRLTEIFEPTYPKGVKSSKIKQAGTQGSVIVKDQYRFSTTKGNDVRVHFEMKDNNEADIIFYVNNTLSDKSSAQQGVTRDEEILPSVLGIVKRVTDKKNIKTLTFSAWSGEGDKKVVKNLDYKKYKPELLKLFNNFYNEIKNHEVTYLPITDRDRELATKFKRELKATPDLYKDRVLKQLEIIKEKIDSDSPQIKGVTDNILYSKKEFMKFKHFLPFYELLQTYSDAVMSNTELGLVKQRNRRKDLYTSLIKRFFPDWKTEIYGDSFTLSR